MMKNESQLLNNLINLLIIWSNVTKAAFVMGDRQISMKYHQGTTSLVYII